MNYRIVNAGTFPSLVKEGWTRHQGNGPVPLIGADGVVCSTSRSHLIDSREALLMNSVRYASIYKEASRHLQTTPAAPANEASRLFINAAATPPFQGVHYVEKGQSRDWALSIKEPNLLKGAAGVVVVKQNMRLLTNTTFQAARYRACAPRPSARA